MQMLISKADELYQVKEEVEADQLLRELLKDFDKYSKVDVKHSISEGYSIKIGKVLIWED